MAAGASSESPPSALGQENRTGKQDRELFSFARLLEQEVWKQAVLQAAQAVAADAAQRSQLFKWSTSDRQDKPPMSQLTGLGRQLARLAGEQQLEQVRRWLDHLKQNPRRADRWPQGPIGQVGKLLKDKQAIWEILEQTGKDYEILCPPTITGGGEPENWQKILAAQNDQELNEALRTAGLTAWTQSYHVAVDRWTGGAAESFLYTVLEPHRTEWEPIVLVLDLLRLRQQDHLPAVALLLLLLRDLAAGRLPLGFATNRGMGAVQIESIEFSCYDCAETLSQLDGIQLPGGSFRNMPSEMLNKLQEEWQRWINTQNT